MISAQHRPSTRVRSAGALGLYVLASLALFGWPVLRSLSTTYVGADHPDVASEIWFLAWWPHALAHGLHLLHPAVVWAPGGADISWGTAVPGPALLLAPLTALAGPVVSYNLLILLAPALAAWTAYLLCHVITGRWWPSLAGGWVFGFSTYVMAQMRNHVHAALVFPVPLLAYLVVRHVDEDLSDRSFVAGMVATLVLLLSIFTETLFLACAVGGTVMLIVAVRSSGERRRRWERTVAASLVAGVGTIVLVSPYLWAMLRHIPPVPLHRPVEYSADLANFVLPSRVTLAGPHLRVPNLSEAVAYLGLPLLAVIGLFAVDPASRPARRLLLATPAVLVILALGPVLHLHGATRIRLPWSVLERAPVLDSALPTRLMLHVWLAAAVIFAVWLASQTLLPRAGLWLLSGLVVVSLLPNLPARAGNWHTAIRVPAFVGTGPLRQAVRPGGTLLAIPYAQCGRSMLWQVRTHWSVALAEGYVGGTVPTPFRLRVVEALYTGQPYPGMASDLTGFLAAHTVDAVAVVDGTPGHWTEIFASLGPGEERGGVRLWRVDRTAPVGSAVMAPALTPSAFPGCPS